MHFVVEIGEKMDPRIKLAKIMEATNYFMFEPVFFAETFVEVTDAIAIVIV
jgi:hypothetical protein